MQASNLKAYAPFIDDAGSMTTEIKLLRYLKFLSIRHPDPVISNLIHSTEHAIHDVSTVSETFNGFLDMTLPLAKIVNIDNDSAVEEVYGITSTDMLDCTKRASALNEFISALDCHREDVQTRVVIFMDPGGEVKRWTDMSYDRTAEVEHFLRSWVHVLALHVMIVELDMQYTEAWSLHCLPESRFASERRVQPYWVPNVIQFNSERRPAALCALDMERCALTSKTFTVVVRFGASNIPWVHSTLPSYGLTTILPASEYDRMVANDHTVSKTGSKPLGCAMESYLDFLEASCKQKCTLQPQYTQNCHWLRAAIDFTYQIQAYELFFLVDDIPTRLMSWADNEEEYITHTQELLRLRSSLAQLRAFWDNNPNVARDACLPSVTALEQLTERFDTRLGGLKRSLDNYTTHRSITMAELSIAESRSTIAVTVLAFAFVPISLAASIFGMNVQQINQTGHSIWAFLATAIGLIVASALSWLCWRAARSLRTLYYAVEKIVDWPYQSWQAEDVSYWTKMKALLGEKEFSRWRRYKYWLGFSGVEKLGIQGKRSREDSTLSVDDADV